VNIQTDFTDEAESIQNRIPLFNDHQEHYVDVFF
jgi:hypothetical protein